MKLSPSLNMSEYALNSRLGEAQISIEYCLLVKAAITPRHLIRIRREVWKGYPGMLIHLLEEVVALRMERYEV